LLLTTRNKVCIISQKPCRHKTGSINN